MPPSNRRVNTLNMQQSLSHTQLSMRLTMAPTSKEVLG